MQITTCKVSYLAQHTISNYPFRTFVWLTGHQLLAISSAYTHEKKLGFIIIFLLFLQPD